MQLFPLKTQRVKPDDDLMMIIQQALKDNQQTIQLGDIVVMASKVMAYSQGLLKKIDSPEAFKDLIRHEADEVLDEGDMVLTMKNKIMIPNAGIDNSNTPDNQVVLWPKKPFEGAFELRKKLMTHFNLSELGVLITDSHCQPLRQGTSGIAIGWAGFEGVKDERGAADLFGRKMAYTKIAVADDLACAANVLMGETDASIPLVLIRGFAANFTDKKFSGDDYFIAPSECLYRPLYRRALL